LRHTFLRNVADDSADMERVVMESDLDWTIARPPRLTNSPIIKGYRAKVDTLPKGAFFMGRADLAQFLLDEAERNEYVRHIVGLTSSRMHVPIPSPERVSSSR